MREEPADVSIESERRQEANRNARSVRTALARAMRSAAIWGPGLLVMLADTDAGNVVTAAQGGMQWGYRLLPLLLALIPMLYLVQELTIRLGVYTGRGHGELIRERFGPFWAYLSFLGLAAATIGSLITEFTAVAGVGELYGLSRALTLSLALAFLLFLVGAGSYRRVEKIAIAVGLFELAFFIVALTASPNLADVARDAVDPRWGDTGFMYLVAAIVGATFNPWMIFYQQSAIADKGLQPGDIGHARLDTGVGAVLTQCLTAAVLIAAAARLRSGDLPANLSSIGDISRALTPLLGAMAGRVVFSAGVLGASLVAAVVSSLALAWGLGEITGYRRSLASSPFEAPWFFGVYAASAIGSAALVWFAPNLVPLTIAAQILNALLMPLVIGLLVALAMTALPETARLRGRRLWLVLSLSATACGLSLWGGLSWLFAALR